MEQTIEMLIEAQAADIKFRLEWINGECRMTCEDTATDLPKEGREVTKVERVISPNQAAAVIALFVAGDMEPVELNEQLYEIAETAVSGIPFNCRPIL